MFKNTLFYVYKISNENYQLVTLITLLIVLVLEAFEIFQNVGSMHSKSRDKFPIRQFRDLAHP